MQNREVKGIYAVRKQLGTRKGIKWAEGKAVGNGHDETQVPKHMYQNNTIKCIPLYAKLKQKLKGGREEYSEGGREEERIDSGGRRRRQKLCEFKAIFVYISL